MAVHDPEPFAIITGDTFFNAGVGNCKNGGDPKALYATIQRDFMHLKDDIIVYPGHDYLANNLEFSLSLTPDNQEIIALKETLMREKDVLTNMGVEKKINQFLRLDDKNLQAALQTRFPEATFHAQDQIFLSLRQLRDQW